MSLGMDTTRLHYEHLNNEQLDSLDSPASVMRKVAVDEPVVADILATVRQRCTGSIAPALKKGGHRLHRRKEQTEMMDQLVLLDGNEIDVTEEHLFKVIIIGDATVGKTSFVQRYIQDTFRRDYKGTVGVDFALKVIRWSDTDTVKLQLWDIAGQERFTWMTRVYYKDAQGCIIMFDLTNRASFLNCAKWKSDVEAKCCGVDGSPIPCIMLANKCDLAHRAVDQLEIEKLYQDRDFIGWTETSVKEGLMVADSVRFLVDILMQQRAGRYSDLHTRVESPLHLTGGKREQEEGSKCAC